MREPVPWDVTGSVRGEIFLVWLNGDRLELTGPDGPVPWIVQLDDVEHPVESADRIVRGLVGPPLLVHSTSWRREGAAVLLSFVVVIGPDQVTGHGDGSDPPLRAGPIGCDQRAGRHRACPGPRACPSPPCVAGGR